MDNAYPSHRAASENGSSDPMLDKSAHQVAHMIDVSGVLRVLRIYKWMILVVVLAGSGLGFLVGLSQTAKYTATAEILVEPLENDVNNIVGDTSSVLDKAALETEVRLLKSRDFIELIIKHINLLKVVEEWRLLDVVELRERWGHDSTSNRSSLGNIISWFGISHDREALGIKNNSHRLSMERKVETFYENFDVQRSGDSHVISIIYTSDDPKEAANITNQVAETYISNRRDNEKDNNTETKDWLNDRASALREKLQKDELEIDKVRTKNNLGDINNDAQSSELAAFNTELIKLRSETSTRQARLAALRQLRSNGQPVYHLPEISGDAKINELRAEQRQLTNREIDLGHAFGNRHPEMLELQAKKKKIDELIEQEIERIALNLTSDLRVLRQQEAAFEAEIQQLTNRSTAKSDIEIQLREREREADATRQIYQTVLQRSKQMNEKSTNVQPGIRLISRATPPTMSDTSPPLLLGIVGFCASLLGGIMLAILRECQDQRIRSEQQVREYLGIRLLAMVPQVKGLRRQKRKKLHDYMLTKPMSVYTDAIRNTLMDLKREIHNKGARVAVITSTLPNEGKTSFALSLASLAARSRIRTLIIDLDLRCPSIHQELDVMRHPSILDCLQGTASGKSIIWTHPNIDTLDVVMPMTPHAIPTDIVDSEGIALFLNQARANYDLIIVDSAPIFAVSEARLVASLSDIALFLIRWGETDIETAQAGLRKLRECNVEIAGAVLSQVDFRKHRMYQFHDAGQHFRKYAGYYVN